MHTSTATRGQEVDEAVMVVRDFLIDSLGEAGVMEMVGRTIVVSDWHDAMTCLVGSRWSIASIDEARRQRFVMQVDVGSVTMFVKESWASHRARIDAWRCAHHVHSQSYKGHKLPCAWPECTSGYAGQTYTMAEYSSASTYAIYGDWPSGSPVMGRRVNFERIETRYHYSDKVVWRWHRQS